MTDTYFYLPEAKKEELVDVWYTKDFDPSTVAKSFQDDYPISGHKTYFSGGGGLSSTSSDYLKFASALLNKGEGNENRVLNKQTVELMMSNRIDTLYIGEGEQFGYGGSVFTHEGRLGQKPGRYSWSGYWQTNFWVDPQRNMVCIILTNVIYPVWGPFFDRYEEIINHAVIEK
jgi:CubicO group peptidase (beta-lactamase class C family)